MRHKVGDLVWWRTPNNVSVEQHGVNPNTVVRTPISELWDDHYETENEAGWVSVLPSEIIEPTPKRPTWEPCYNDEIHNDQACDIPYRTDTESFWAEIGPSLTGWSYTITATNDEHEQYEVLSGECASEAAAKTIVEGWRP